MTAMVDTWGGIILCADGDIELYIPDDNAPFEVMRTAEVLTAIYLRMIEDVAFCEEAVAWMHKQKPEQVRH